jgi:hypothetical protein
MSGASAAPGEALESQSLEEVVKKRRAKREPVRKVGKIIAGASGTVTDCEFHDESAHGVLAVTATPLPVPERVMIKLNNGALKLATRRWTNGSKIGFEFDKIPEGAEPSRQLLRHVKEILENKGPDEAIHVLRASRFFNSSALRYAAEDVEAAQRRFAALLK